MSRLKSVTQAGFGVVVRQDEEGVTDPGEVINSLGKFKN